MGKGITLLALGETFLLLSLGEDWIFVSFALLLTVVLIVGATIDWHYYILPDEGAILLTLGGVVYSAYTHMAWWHYMATPFCIGIIGWSIRYVSGGGFGWGDIKWLTALSLWLPLDGAMFALILSFWLGTATLMVKRNVARPIVPFGPFLCMAHGIVFFSTHWIGGDFPWLALYLHWMNGAGAI